MERDIPDLQPKIVLAIGAHPDDLEFGTSGSAAAWVKAGAEVHYLICTDGSKGSDDPNLTSPQLIKLRRDEQRAAAKILGVSSVTFLDHEDGLTEANAALKRDIVRVIRKIKPDTVVAQDPLMVYSAEFGVINHNDHRNVGLAAMDAVYPLARDHLSFPELAAAGLAPHKVTDLLFMGSFDDRANFYVDISGTYDTKLEALAAHASQVDVEGVRPFLDAMSARMGKKAGYGMAEGFIRLHMFI
jgi:LmbE family N-acetylglucosaminyl deacetylase